MKKGDIPRFTCGDNGEGQILLRGDSLRFAVGSKLQARIMAEVLQEKDYINSEEERFLLVQINQSSLPENTGDKKASVRHVAELVTRFANLPWPPEITQALAEEAEDDDCELSSASVKTAH